MTHFEPKCRSQLKVFTFLRKETRCEKTIKCKGSLLAQNCFSCKLTKMHSRPSYIQPMLDKDVLHQRHLSPGIGYCRRFLFPLEHKTRTPHCYFLPKVHKHTPTWPNTFNWDMLGPNIGAGCFLTRRVTSFIMESISLISFCLYVLKH